MHEFDVFAHVAGVPVEELAPFAYGVSALWVGLRVLGWRLRRRYVGPKRSVRTRSGS